MRRAVVLFSGGLDSTVLLTWALRRFDVVTLAVERADRPRGERRAERRVLEALGATRHHRVALPDGVEAWTRGSSARSFVPGRNLFYHAAALLLARRVGARWVVAGHNRGDADAFPDARRRFFTDLERLANVDRARTEPPVGILTPFLRLTKTQVANLGAALDAPLDLSWSCYRDGSAPCGRCVACRERRAALTASARPAPRPAARPPRAAPRGASGPRAARTRA